MQKGFFFAPYNPSYYGIFWWHIFCYYLGAGVLEIVFVVAPIPRNIAILIRYPIKAMACLPRNLLRSMSFLRYFFGPDPLRTPLPEPDSDPILTRSRPDLDLKRRISSPNRVEIGSKSGPNQVRGVGFGGGRVQRGRSGWEGSVAPPESLDSRCRNRAHEEPPCLYSTNRGKRKPHRTQISRGGIVPGLGGGSTWVFIVIFSRFSCFVNEVVCQRTNTEMEILWGPNDYTHTHTFSSFEN